MVNDLRSAKKQSMNCLLINLFALLMLVFSDSQPEEIRIIQEIQDLREQIQHHDKLYYQTNEPEISDQAYDQLREQLEDLENKWPECSKQAGSASPSFGDDRSVYGASDTHRVPMLSLKKCYTEEDVTQFYEWLVSETGEPDVELRLEPKVDGVAVSAIYENGLLKKVLTRGDGQLGEDVTDPIRQTGCLPEQLTSPKWIPSFLELRGEAYIPLSKFEQINAEQVVSGKKPFVSPRNLAAGTLRMKELDAVTQRGLKIVIFSFGTWLPEKEKPLTEGKFRGFLILCGIPVIESVSKARDLTDLIAKLGAMSRDRVNWDFPTDGIVMELEDIGKRNRLGLSHKGPNWAAAYKFPSATAKTVLVGIDWQTGPTGKVTPVARLKPVLVDGRKVERANLYNEEYINRNNFRIGDEVTVELKGGAIPLLKITDSDGVPSQ